MIDSYGIPRPMDSARIRAMYCPSCRQSLHDDAHFCSNCGLSTRQFNTATQIAAVQETVPYTRAEDHLLGRVLDSKYELVELLGQGAMGAVYRAHRLHIGDEVAVKLLHADLVLEGQAVERFRREARSAAMISHPNVVSIHDFSDGHSKGAPAYIVMELVKGVSLRTLLKQEGRLSAERAVALMRDICAGVGIAHRQGVLHRDLKPDNVIIKPAIHEGELESAKVVDFGLAKLRDVAGGSALTQTGTVIGTLYYMSPEQCSGEELDARADVYSLGAMLFEMLTGGPPFEASNFVGLISKHLHEPPPPFPGSLKISPALAAACTRALAKKRELRQADAVAFSRELQAALKAPQPAAPANLDRTMPIAPAPQIGLQRRRRMHWLKWAAAFAALLALVGVIGAALAIKYGALDLTSITHGNSNNKPANTNQKVDSGPNNNSASGEQGQATPTATKSPAAEAIIDLRGTWTGTYGPFSQPARLIIKNHKDKKFDGVLEQGAIRIAFNGSVDASVVKMKQSAVLKGGESSWALGEDVGTITANGKRMSGTGKDPVGGIVGMSYEWTFSRP
jgi:serine/threonine protein kinase